MTPWDRTMAVLCLLVLLSSMTGCGRKFVLVDSSQPVTTTKAELDRLYSDNEALLAALKACKEAKK